MEEVGMVSGDTCVGVRMGFLRVVSSGTTHESWLHFVFTMLHFVFNMFRTWRHAGEAARLRILAWASIAENPGWRQLAEISLAENSWLRIPGSGNLWALNAWGRVFFHG